MADLAAEVVGLLRSRGQTVAVAESLTGGGLCAALTSVPGASEVLRGGLVVYTDDVKVTMAGVPRDLLQRKGAVDPTVAVRLAEGARERCGADWGIGLTGVAGPGPSCGVAAGTVFAGLAGAGVTRCWSLRLPGDRARVRSATIEHALRLFGEHLTAERRS
ncbi:MAG: CinA family protein [Thermocrispum sp.]